MDTSQDPRFLEAIRLFNEGEFYDSHHEMEDVWRGTQGKEKPFYQGLIQAAAAFHHLKRGRLRPAISLKQEAIKRIQPFAPVAFNLDVAKFAQDLEAFFKPLENGEVSESSFEKLFPPKITFVAK